MDIPKCPPADLKSEKPTGTRPLPVHALNILYMFYCKVSKGSQPAQGMSWFR
jgi:hypothetical protein